MMKMDDRKKERADRFNRHKRKKDLDREPRIRQVKKKNKYKLNVNHFNLSEDE
jgi:ribosomal protein S8E